MFSAWPTELLLLFPLLSTLTSALPVGQTGRDFPPRICTISKDQWSNLNATVGGRLHRREPNLFDCSTKAHAPTSNSGSEDAGIYISWAYREYLQRHLSTCYSIDKGCTSLEQKPFTPSRQDYREPLALFYIDAQTPQDVAEAFHFSRHHGIALSIEPGPTSLSAGYSLALRTESLKSKPVFTDAFVPQGCTKQATEAITVGAATTHREIYEFADTIDRTVVAGFNPDEPVSKWLASGGHGPLTNTFGLGVDNALQVKVVLPDGSYTTASECHNRELWFALRGGGENSFGIITEVTFKALPKLELEVAYLRFLSSDHDSIAKFTKLCIEHANEWAGLGWGGYIVPGSMSQLASGLILATPLIDHEKAVQSMQQITQFGAAHSHITANNTVKTVESFGSFYNEYILPNIATALPLTDVAIGSRLISASQFSSKQTRELLYDTLDTARTYVEHPDDLTNAMIAPNSSPLTIFLTPPTLHMKDFDTSSVSPAWREATWLVSVAAVVPTEPLPSEYIKADLQAGHANRLLRENLPLSWGAALSEGHSSEPMQAVFWGDENLGILREIKTMVDGKGLLRCESKTCIRPKSPLKDGFARMVEVVEL